MLMPTAFLVFITLIGPSLSIYNLTSPEIAAWDKPRGALIRHDIFLEGGFLQKATTWSDSDDAWDPAPRTVDDMSLFKLSLNRSFDINDDKAPALFEGLEGNTIGTEWLDGYMFHDDDEFYAYGGAYINRELLSSRTVACVVYDEQEGEEVDPVQPNPLYAPEGGSFIRSIAYGAGASVPSENLSFYFGGMQMQDGSQIGYFRRPSDRMVVSRTLITVDTAEQKNADWQYIDPTSDTILTRAHARMVWIPVGEQGLLIVVGGVLAPTDVLNNNIAWPNDTMEVGNNFTQEFAVYDIASRTWFSQPLKSNSFYPDINLAQFCTVVAPFSNGTSDSDHTHFDIYVYGGWDGNQPKSITEKVYVLTVPTFEWITLDVSGHVAPARQGHLCFKPYPDQMMVIGGTGMSARPLGPRSGIDVFDLNDLAWTGRYDPRESEHRPYSPTNAIRDAVAREPFASSMPQALRDIFSTRYSKEIKEWGPYTLIDDSAGPVPTNDPGNGGDDDGQPGWVVPVAATLGVVGGLAIIGIILFCWRRRRIQKARDNKRHSNVTSETAKQGWITKWIGGTASDVPPGKDLASETYTEPEGNMATPAQMSEAHPSELEGRGYFPGSPRTDHSRWSSSTAVRQPADGSAGPHEVHADSSFIHEAGARSPVPGSDIRQYPLYPPSVVSGGHPRSVRSESISQPTDAGNASDGAASPTPSRSPPPPGTAAAMSSIPEAARFSLDHNNEEKRDDSGLARATSGRAVSPILGEDGTLQRPGHRRHNSSWSSTLSPLPSPGMVDRTSAGGADQGHTI
ncbi:uncharacterized protein HMPREF1541_00603 [Cyphellophora europaea CBS 101466]|uniref:Kelch repeat protein n=1 Tax=Cyphellophora europaea (strain CBS 101466) TaxID=1220924 RepID=W2SEW0_CYPE1|nr:uncharacterized protein HMPREF1541_00603 [Cyphellophora europaea CBS 101466]ETN46419.1 hypothetical protein HMPREF1541_00603 [Cyphellophora europaea CBS 101466]